MLKNYTIVPGDTIFINSDDYASNGKFTIKEIRFFPESTQVGITTTDGKYISTAYHFIEKVI